MVPGQPRLQLAMMSRAGARPRNEDACAHWGDPPGPLCCVLADGAGGHGGGDVAARLAVTTVLELFAAGPACDPATVDRLISAANRAVVERQPSSDATRDMRSTLVVWIADPAQQIAVWGHSGDSRLYRFRNGSVVERTRDHSLFETLVDAGIIDPSSPTGLPPRNILVASLGSLDAFDASIADVPIPLQAGDAFLLCSDGFWDPLADREIEGALQRADGPAAWLDDLAQTIVGRNRSGQDNYSAVAIWYGSADFRTRIAAPAATPAA